MIVNAASILWPMLAQIGLTFFLYAWLTVVRTQAVRRGEVGYSCYVTSRDEPRQVARVSRNLSNQFELPAIFYAVVVMLVALGHVNAIDVTAAWVFVAGRIVHTLVQTLTDNVPLRGQVFTINFLAVVVLVGHVMVLAIEGIGK
jgi:hypothetical protein